MLEDNLTDTFYAKAIYLVTGAVHAIGRRSSTCGNHATDCCPQPRQEIRRQARKPLLQRNDILAEHRSQRSVYSRTAQSVQLSSGIPEHIARQENLNPIDVRSFTF